MRGRIGGSDRQLGDVRGVNGALTARETLEVGRVEIPPQSRGVWLDEPEAGGNASGHRSAEVITGVRHMRAQNTVAKPFDGRPFDVSQLEGDIREAVQQRPPRLAKPPQMPEYVSHHDDTSEIGKLSAEAIAREYEVTAKEIEAMGDVVRDMVQRCEQLTTSASSMLKDIKATATRYRQEGKRIFDEIEACSGAADEVRKLCEGFRDKIAAKTAEGAS
jgi:hypothetical protein